MRERLVVGNSKSNLTEAEGRNLLEGLRTRRAEGEAKPGVVIIACFPFTALSMARKFVQEHNFKIGIGAQNVSRFGPGAYTGEQSAEQVKEFADYVIIAHSERRTLLGETDEDAEKKVEEALRVGLEPIFCVQNENTPVPKGVKIVAYEPPTAIGTGEPDTPENAARVARVIKEKYADVESVLYGGSVSEKNVADFTSMEEIDGVLVGGASLDADKFNHIIENA